MTIEHKEEPKSQEDQIVPDAADDVVSDISSIGSVNDGNGQALDDMEEDLLNAYVYLQQQIIKMMQENVEEKIQLEDMFKLTDDKIEEYWGQSSAPRSYHKDNLYFDFL